jgi:predicted membrane protein
MAKDLLKPVEEQYVHSIMSTEHSGILIFTFLSRLLALIHKALTIQVDTTFKRTAGDINEWELVIWYQELQRGKLYYIPRY